MTELSIAPDDRTDPVVPDNHGERAALDRLLTDARSGAGGALVLRGAAGTGKTDLLAYAAGRATGIRVARTAGVEPESSYGFAALHRLLLPFLPGLDRLPRPQRDALRTAFGIVGTAVPDLFLVGLAVLTLLSDAAAARPLLVTVDDAQWLDETTTAVLAFVARRLGTCRIALALAVREPTDRCRPLAGLPEIHLRGRRDAGDLLTLAWCGREDDTRAAADELLGASIDQHSGVGVTRAHYALTILELGLGRYESAAASALQVYRDDPPDFGTQILPDLVEAAARSGQLDAAESALERLADRAQAGGTCLGLLTRSRALLADDTQAERLYRAAIEQPTAAVHRARAHLLYGEWLRRRRRRRDARQHLSTAHETFDKLGAGAFAGRAWIELQATGERLDRPGELTPQEEQVARLVVEGSSNRQVATQLFISHNTVEYHLQKIFRKLGVTSRTQLVRALLPAVSPSAGAR
jgi:DNA-binding CsgD family transcriptional regulator